MNRKRDINQEILNLLKMAQKTLKIASELSCSKGVSGFTFIKTGLLNADIKIAIEHLQMEIREHEEEHKGDISDQTIMGEAQRDLPVNELEGFQLPFHGGDPDAPESGQGIAQELE